MATDYSNLAQEMNDAEPTTTSNNDDDFDHGDAPILNITPTVAIEYDEILEVDMMGGVKEEQNVRTKGGYGNDIVVVLKNPTIGEGTLFDGRANDKGADYKLVDTDYERVEEDVSKDENGDFQVTGIRVYDAPFDSEETDEFEEDVVRLMVGSAAGQRIAQVLDCYGGLSAYYDEDGEKTNGLIEYPPEYSNDDYNPRENDGDRYTRLARTPTLREDMVGEPGVIFMYLADDDSGMHKVDLFKGSPSVENALGPVTDGEPEWSPWLYWDEPDNDESGNPSDDNSSGNEGDDDVDLSALEGASDGADNDGTIETYNDLSEEQKSFVDKLDGNEAIDVTTVDISNLYRKFAEDNDLPSIDASVIENIVLENCE